MAKKKFFDVWMLQANTVYKEVPYSVVADWAQDGRLVADDRIRPSGTAEWYTIGGFPEMNVFLPQPEPGEIDDQAEALEAVDGGFTWKRRPEDEEDDPDMIPLIDVSLVLLIFFMMTTTVAAVSRVLVPDTANVAELTDNPEAFWMGVDRDPVTGDPLYAISRGTEAPAPEDEKLSLQEVLAKFDERIKKQSVPVEVRVAAHREIVCDVVDELTYELEIRRQRDKVRIQAIYAEVNEQVQ